MGFTPMLRFLPTMSAMLFASAIWNYRDAIFSWGFGGTSSGPYGKYSGALSDPLGPHADSFMVMDFQPVNNKMAMWIFDVATGRILLHCSDERFSYNPNTHRIYDPKTSDPSDCIIAGLRAYNASLHDMTYSD